ncbi:MAG: ester cyclase [Chloroflexi bacterium]|nr:ester cyclase [Chloroflexota bacterium]
MSHDTRSRVTHSGTPSLPAPGAAGQAAIAAGFRTAFPDARWHVDLMLAEANLVAARWTATGTFTGPWGAISPTGRRAKFSGVNIFRFRDRKVAEISNHRDDLGLMRQVEATVFAGASTVVAAGDRRPDPSA